MSFLFSVLFSCISHFMRFLTFRVSVISRVSGVSPVSRIVMFGQKHENTRNTRKPRSPPKHQTQETEKPQKLDGTQKQEKHRKHEKCRLTWERVRMCGRSAFCKAVDHNAYDKHREISMYSGSHLISYPLIEYTVYYHTNLRYQKHLP